MAETSNACSIQNLLNSVLAIEAKEQNFAIPPEIFQNQVRTVASLLLSELCESYPDSPEYIDMLMPFMATKMLAVTNGVVVMPDNYRNILGSPSVMAIKENGEDCECSDVVTPTSFKDAQAEARCKTNPVLIVSNTEFDYRTRSSYDYPTLDNPIGYWVSKKTLKVCPYNISRVEVRYCIQETPCFIKYIIQPDDTWVIDPAGTIETGFSSAAYEPFYNALVALYSAYSRDSELAQWSIVLKNGIL